MIKRILSILTLLVGGLAFADVPNTFQAGEAIKASEMNENFTSIDNQVSQVESDVDNLTTKTANYSDIESDVASLKAKVELLESLLGSDDASVEAVEFVGVSSATTAGNGGGLSGMNQMCEVTYLGSRMCKSKEINISGYPTIPRYQGTDVGYAWVHNNSDVLHIESESASNLDYVRYAYKNWMTESHKGPGNCQNWNLNHEATGTVLRSNYDWNGTKVYSVVTGCSNIYPVACCK